MKTQTISPEIIPKKKDSFKGLTNWFNNSFSSYEIESKDRKQFNLFDKKDKILIREVSKSQIARLKRRINQVT